MPDLIIDLHRGPLAAIHLDSDRVLSTLGVICAIIVVALIVRWLVHRLIDRVAEGLAMGTRGLAKGADALARQELLTTQELARREQRGRTIASVLKSAASAVIGTVAALTILDGLSIPVAPLMASAGIAGVALGFGAQSLVKDVISGLFMLAEDQYAVGDVVDLGEAVGTVEAVGLRITRLRDSTGTVWYVRNGEIQRVGNRSGGSTRSTVDIPIAYDEDQARAERAVEQVGAELRADDTWGSRLLGDPEMIGVQNFSAEGVTLQVALTTDLADQAAVVAEFRRRVLRRFGEDGIKAAHQLPARKP